LGDTRAFDRFASTHPMSHRFFLTLLAAAALCPAARAVEDVAPIPPLETMPRLGPLDEAPFEPPPSIPLEEAEASFEHAHASSAAAAHDLHLLPQGLVYRSYLAGAKESRFRSVWNHEENDGNIWDITLGGNVGILRYGTRGDARPEGWQLGIEGAGLVRLDIDENRDVDAADYRFGVPLSWGDSIHQVKFAYYHLSSHVGDEFLLKHPGFVRLNYSRDVLVYGHSLYPRDDWRVYGEIGFAVDTDVGDPWELQFGVDWAPAGRTGARGAPFAAVNGHLREELNYGGNAVAQAGWCWRRSPASGLFRVGVEYYNGKDDQFSFFDESVEKVGLAIWYDY
jgi:hypothetical protein